MNRSSFIRGILPLAAAALLAGCAGMGMGPAWTTLIDGDKGLDNWKVVGDTAWRAEGGAIVSSPGKPGFLVSKASYQDFEIRAEFWAETDTNSGIFFRAADPTKITADNSYEANIWDIRPEPKYGTGAIVNFAEVPTPIQNKAGDHVSGQQRQVRLGPVCVAVRPRRQRSGGRSHQVAQGADPRDLTPLQGLEAAPVLQALVSSNVPSMRSSVCTVRRLAAKL